MSGRVSRRNSVSICAFTVILALGVGAAAPSVRASRAPTTVTWISATGGSWHDPAKWDAGVPQAGDNVVIDQPGALIISISAPTAAISSLTSAEFVSIDSTLTVASEANFDGGMQLSSTIAGGVVQLRSAGEWRGGTISGGQFIVAAGQTLTINSVASSSHFLNSTTFQNFGTVAWAAGTINYQFNASITNEVGGLFDAQGDHAIVTSNPGNQSFTNAGTFRRSAGAGVMQIASGSFSNTGTLQIQTGTFMSAGWTTSGALAVSAGATLNLQDATLLAGTTFSGSGTLTIPGNTVVATNLTVPLPIVLTGTLSGPGVVTLGAPMTWTSGAVNAGGVVVPASRTLTISSTNTHVLSNSTLQNSGTVTWTGGNFSFDATSSVTNGVGGLWDVQGDLAFVSTNPAVQTFTNAGTFRKSVGFSTFQFAGVVTLQNTGTLEIQTGTFLNSSGTPWTSSGLLSVASGATLNLQFATLQAGSTFAGSGTLTMPGTTTLAANLTVSLPIVLTGTLNGPGVLTLAAPMTWTAGTVNAGGLVVPATRTLTMSSTNTHVLSNSTLQNSGTVTWTGGNFSLDGTSSVTNANGALWDAQGDLAIVSTNAAVQTFTNAGTFRKSAGLGTFQLASAAAFSNTGTLQVQTGTFLNSTGTPWSSSGLLSVSNGATLNLQYATLQAGCTFAGSGTLTMPGTTTLAAGLTVPLPIVLTGTLNGPGILTLAAPMTWSSGSVLGSGLVVPTGQTLTLSTTNTKTLSNSTLQNSGTVTWTNGNFSLDGTSSVTNANGALWDAQGDLAIVSTNAAVQAFTNAGTFRKSAGLGTFQLASAAPFSNTGTLQVQTGTFLNSTGTPWTSSGLLSVSNGATLNLQYATLQAGSTFAGSGTLTMPGTTTFAASLTVPLPVVLSGTLNGPGILTLAAPMTWSSGSVVSGGLVVAASQTLTLSTTNTKTLSSSTLQNSGTVTWANGNFSLDGTSSVTNANGALWDAQGDLAIVSTNAAVQAFTNAGTFRKSAGLGTFQLASVAPFTNTGSLEVQIGTFLNSTGTPWTSSGLLSVSNGATLNLQYATLEAGTTFAGSGTLTMPGTTNFAVSLTVPLPVVLSGTLNGPGTLTLAAPMTWSSGSVVGSGLVVPAGQTLTLNTTNTKTLSNSTLQNSGTLSWSGGNLAFDAATTVTNANSGLIEVQNNLAMVTITAGVQIFNNAGTLNKTGALGTFQVTGQVQFTNTGTVKIRVGGLASSLFDAITTNQVTLGGTLDVTLVNGFVPTFRDAFNVLTYSARTGVFTTLNNTNFAVKYNPFVGTLKFAQAPALFELIRNGSFASGMNFWQVFATPNLSFISSNIVSGVFEYYRVPPPPDTGNQALVFQETEASLLANSPLVAAFDLGNSSAVRKRVSVLMIDADFSDISVCTFFMEPNSPLRTYRMKTHTTKPWTDASIYFYAATAGDDGGRYRVDNVSLMYDPDEATEQTDCIDPLAPPPGPGQDEPNLLVNGDFNAGLTAWSLFGQIQQQVSGGVFQFNLLAGTPSGVVLQPTGQPMTAGQLLRSTFQLGNSSGDRKRVTVIIHDLNFSDLSACTFWLAPNQALSDYTINTYTTKAWTNATISFYPATVGTQEWILLDNATLARTPTLVLNGTDCIEPAGSGGIADGSQSQQMPSSGDVTSIANADAATTTRRLSLDSKGDDSSLRGAGILDLTGVERSQLVVRWDSPDRDATAEVQFSVDGEKWQTIASIAAADGPSPVTINLDRLQGMRIYVRVVLHGVDADGAVPELWILTLPPELRNPGTSEPRNRSFLSENRVALSPLPEHVVQIIPVHQSVV